MRKVLVTCTAMIAALLLCPMTHGELIGVYLGLPDILSNTTGTYHYDAETNLFSFAAAPVFITYDGINPIYINPGTYSAKFYVDESGNFAGGYDDPLTPQNDPDLLIIGNGGNTTFVAGEVTNFGWLDNDPYAEFDFTFDFVGGTLDPYYEMYDYKGGDVSKADISDFENDWTVSHEGIKVKHDTAPGVPEASTLMLFGSGLSGVLFYVKKKGLIKL